jgi:CheY-like chemotaxis protein
MPYRNILLIDDDEDDQELFLEAIDDLAESVVIKVLDNAKTALQVLESKQLMADLIFLDLNMPIMDGQDFLRAIKKNETLKEIPVIVLSTTSNPVTIKYAMELGAKDFITKPSKFSDLKKILKSIIK